MLQITRLCMLLCLAVGCALAWPGLGFATSSSNYKISEDFVGGSGSNGGGSSNFQAQDNFSGAALGESTGTTFKAQSGASSDPSLAFSVGAANVSLGNLSPSATKTAAATFSVLNYTSYGYVVQILGAPPNNGAHALAAITAPAASSVGTEQFGINLVANTSPALGADPQQIPDNTFGFGNAAAGYNTGNAFKYQSGDIIASAPKSSGQTNYTISYIANTAISTPGGSYASNQTLICTGTY